MGKKVPPILLSGHHANIEKWRREQSIIRTKERRPDLLEKCMKSGVLDKERNEVFCRKLFGQKMRKMLETIYKI